MDNHTDDGCALSQEISHSGSVREGRGTTVAWQRLREKCPLGSAVGTRGKWGALGQFPAFSWPRFTDRHNGAIFLAITLYYGIAVIIKYANYF